MDGRTDGVRTDVGAVGRTGPDEAGRGGVEWCGAGNRADRQTDRQTGTQTE
ncbi:hypothetical protein DPMN_145936 [Dreissena polymorpha]|uniref:Uncharacterized protein n=1 Tax=Dreissena polymorpha TaxID=45954 RepID=A0A9D4J1I8_DREPO|nr:hypothetical protein DPMN_145936 [Dreissena polymorpha]